MIGRSPGSSPALAPFPLATCWGFVSTIPVLKPPAFSRFREAAGHLPRGGTVRSPRGRRLRSPGHALVIAIMYRESLGMRARLCQRDARERPSSPTLLPSARGEGRTAGHSSERPSPSALGEGFGVRAVGSEGWRTG